MAGKTIVIITSGQPSLNPRLVKEADALSSAGYRVTVLYAYWNDWGTRNDEQLLANKKWKATRAGGSPRHGKAAWFLSRLIHKTCRYMLQSTGNYARFAEVAISRASWYLTREAKKHKADLYIGHNLGALPAVVKTATRFNKPCGFDAEDFHRQEVSNDVNSLHYKISAYIEDKYLPSVDYLTASAPLIACRYNVLYKHKATILLNVFPKTAVKPVFNEDQPLKLFWFSQTIGPNRGLETIIEAMGFAKVPMELHLLGFPETDYIQQLLHLAKDAGVSSDVIRFYEPVLPHEIFPLAAQFDVGLAAETGYCLNRNIALTNKLFTYVQSGLAVAASDTAAQSAFIEQYPPVGKVYSDAKELSGILAGYGNDRELLFKTKQASFQLGQTHLNWENESKKFLNKIEDSLKGLPQ